MRVIDESEFPAIVEIYNRDGRKAANAYIRTNYGLKNPWSVISRIRKTPGYKYDEANNRFIIPYKRTEKQVFMSIDDLCGNKKSQPEKTGDAVNPRNTVSMENLIHELISDRLLELSRYVTLEASSRTILIDRTSMIADGYKAVIH